MYYEEKVIDGKLMCKTHPDEEWREVSYENLLEKYTRLKKRITEIKSNRNELHEKLKSLENLAMDVKNDPLFNH